MADKYVIFKKAEFDWWYNRLGHQAPLSPPELVRDGVVIRRQDIFSPPALDAYANAITIALQVAKELPDDPQRPVWHDLRQIADYFRDQAEQAWDTDRKLPD